MLLDSSDFFIEKVIGEFGFYQRLIFILIFFTQIPITLHEISVIFLASSHEHICKDNKERIVGKCPCDERIYGDNSTFKQTIISQWDLACDRSWMVQLPQTFMLIGILMGCLTFGILADRFGRKTLYRYCALLQSVSSLLAPIIPEFWTYAVLRFINGAGTGGLVVTGYVLMVEFHGSTHREILPCLIHLGVTCGHLLLPLIGFCLRNWKHIHIAHGIISITLEIFYHLLPESVKWLLVVGKIEMAVETLEKIAKRNNRPYINIKEHIVHHYPTGKINAGSPVDLVWTQNIRRNTLAMCFIWLICGFGYYGLSQHMGKLNENIFLHVAITAIVTVPGILFSIPILKLLGRRQVLMLELCISGSVLLIYAAVPDDMEWPMTVITITGKVIIFMATITAYLLSVEMYPTIIRATALGNCLLFAGVGSLAAHYVTIISMPKKWIMLCIFGIVLSGGSLVCVLLPETKGLPLPTMLHENENI